MHGNRKKKQRLKQTLILIKMTLGKVNELRVRKSTTFTLVDEKGLPNVFHLNLNITRHNFFHFVFNNQSIAVMLYLIIGHW